MFVADTIASSQPVKKRWSAAGSRNLRVRIYVVIWSQITMFEIYCRELSVRVDSVSFVIFILHTCPVAGLNILDDRHSVFLHPTVSELVWFKSKYFPVVQHNELVRGHHCCYCLMILGYFCSSFWINGCLLVASHKSKQIKSTHGSTGESCQPDIYGSKWLVIVEFSGVETWAQQIEDSKVKEFKPWCQWHPFKQCCSMPQQCI